MNLFVAKALFSCLTLVACKPFQAPGDRASDDSTIERSVVRLVSADGQPVGTGFVVSVSRDRIVIVTSAHVVRPGGGAPNVPLRAEFFGSGSSPVKTSVINAEDPDISHSALCALSVDRGSIQGAVYPLVLNTSLPKRHDDVVVVGHPAGGPWWVQKAVTEGQEDGMTILDRSFPGGASGSPVVARGRVMALLAFAQGSQSEAVPSSIVYGFLSTQNIPLEDEVATDSKAKSVEVRGDVVTEIHVASGDRVHATAEGSIYVGRFVGRVSPDGKFKLRFGGIPISKSFSIDPYFPHGCLLWRVKGEREWKMCGSNGEFTSASNGSLEFNINDADQTNNHPEDSFKVKVEINQSNNPSQNTDHQVFRTSYITLS